MKHQYVLGSEQEELVRLGFQHRVWASYSLALWERAGFARGQTILDVGCGPGYATLDLSAIVGPEGRILAVDNAERFIEHLRRTLPLTAGAENIEIIQADVRDEAAYPTASVHGAFARWVLCFLPDPERVVSHVARALRPGGVFAIQDYFNYTSLTLAPRRPEFDPVIAAVEESWKRTGGDLDVAAHLPRMLAEAGLVVEEIRPIARVARPGSMLWGWPRTFFAIFVPRLQEMGLVSAEQAEAFARAWEEAERDPHCFFCTPPIYEIIARKPR